jgi:hypothetical protein
VRDERGRPARVDDEGTVVFTLLIVPAVVLVVRPVFVTGMPGAGVSAATDGFPRFRIVESARSGVVNASAASM